MHTVIPQQLHKHGRMAFLGGIARRDSKQKQEHVRVQQVRHPPSRVKQLCQMHTSQSSSFRCVWLPSIKTRNVWLLNIRIRDTSMYKHSIRLKGMTFLWGPQTHHSSGRQRQNQSRTKTNVRTANHSSKLDQQHGSRGKTENCNFGSMPERQDRSRESYHQLPILHHLLLHRREHLHQHQQNVQ